MRYIAVPADINCPHCDSRVRTFPSTTEVTAKCMDCGSIWKMYLTTSPGSTEIGWTGIGWALIGNLYPWRSFLSA